MFAGTALPLGKRVLCPFGWGEASGSRALPKEDMYYIEERRRFQKCKSYPKKKTWSKAPNF